MSLKSKQLVYHFAMNESILKLELIIFCFSKIGIYLVRKNVNKKTLINLHNHIYNIIFIYIVFPGGNYGEGPVVPDRSDLQGLLPELNGVELAMSLSPKHHQASPQVLSHLQQLHHSTPFSVTDILSPIEESYRKLELATNPPSPYR